MLSRLLVASSLIAVVHGAKLKITWEDCGSKHSKITKLEPTVITTGTPTTLTWTGTVDEEVTSAQFTATVKEGFLTIATCKGDATQDIVCKFPFGAGSITVKKMPFPIAKGQVSIEVDVDTTAALPVALERVKIHVAATDQSGESVVCLDASTAPAAEVLPGLFENTSSENIISETSPRGTLCEICKKGVDGLLGKEISECKPECDSHFSSKVLQMACDAMCDKAQDFCQQGDACAEKICTEIHACSPSLVV